MKTKGDKLGATAAKPARANLIVIATHGYPGLKHPLPGSTSERVVVREGEHQFE